MNKIYSKVWNKSLGMLVVASELASANGKGSSTRRLRAAAATLAVGMTIVASSAYAAAGVTPCDSLYPAGHQPTATGTDALSCGYEAAAGGSYSLAFGYLAKANHYAAVVLGANAASNGDYSTVVGSGEPTFINPDGSNRGNFAGMYGSAFGWAAQSNNRGTTALGAYAHAGNAAFGAGTETYDTAVGYKAGAIGGYSTAIGPFTHADGVLSLAVGGSASATAQSAVALGAYSQASGVNSVALGQGSVAVGDNTVSVGSVGGERQIVNVANGVAATDAVNKGQLDSLAGATATATHFFAADGATDGSEDVLAYGEHSVAAGANSSAMGVESAAYGFGSGAFGDNSVALGAGSFAFMTGSSAIGSLSTATGGFSTATGYTSVASGDYSVATGNNAQANATNATATGSSSVASGSNSSAYGAGATASGADSVAVGGTASTVLVDGNGAPIAFSATSAGLGGTAIGASAIASGLAASAVGLGAEADGSESTALGALAYASGNLSTAVGAESAATGVQSLAVGVGSAASASNSVALGVGSVADVANTVSVGSATSQRKIVNMAAGALSATSKEAVNGSQLFTTNTNVAANTASINTINSTAVFYADATRTAVALGNGTTPVTVSNVANGVAATDAVNKGQLDAVAAQAGQIDTSAVKYDDASKGVVTLAGANGSVVANVAAGEVSATSKDAVNGSQLSSTNDAVAQNAADIAANAGNIAANTASIGTINSTAVFYTDASRTTVLLGNGTAPVTLGNVADGSASHDAVNKGQLDAAVASVSSGLGDLADSVVKYDDGSDDQVTLAGSNGTRISNLQASSVLSDAATVGQIADLLGALGGGAMLQAGGSIGMPSFAVQGGSYNNVGDALGALDAALAGAWAGISGIDNRVSMLERNYTSGGTINAHVATDGPGDGTDAAGVMAGSKGVAVGSGATAGGDHGTAIGGDSHAAGPNDTAIGGNAKVHADGSTAVGANTTIAAAATNAVAVGESASVTAASGTAIGQGSSVTAVGAVALGQGSVADRANTISVGTAGNQRQITNVAAGTQATDAANLGQVQDQVQQALVTAKAYADAGDQQTLNQSKAYTDQKLGSFATTSDISALRDQVNGQFHAVDKRMNQVGAMGAAMSQMSFSTQGINTANRVGVGVGGYHGEAALSVGYSRQLSPKANVTFGAAVSGNETSGGVGVGFGW